MEKVNMKETNMEIDEMSHPEETPAEMEKAERDNGTIALLIASVGLALVGQYQFITAKGLPTDGLLFFALAIVIFAFLVLRQEHDETKPPLMRIAWNRTRNFVQREPIRAALIFLSFVLGYTTLRVLLNKTGDDSYWDAFVVWAIGCLVYVLAFVPLPIWWDVRAWYRANRVDIGWVLALTGLAAILRLVLLGSVPDIISGDEGQIGLMALSAARGELNNMFATSHGHSTLYVMLMGLSVQIFGPNPFGLRLLSAVGGTLTVPALYILARRMFDRRVAVIAAGLLVFSHIQLHFSRIIVASSVQDALFATIGLWLLYEGFKSGRTLPFVLSGLTIGVHLYIYMGGRLIVMLLPVFVVTLAILHWQLVRRNLLNLLALTGMLIVAGAPIALWAYQHPDEFMARANQVGVFQSGWLAQQIGITGLPAWRILASLLVDALLSVNYYPAEAFYRSTYPMLDFVAGAFFFLGLTYSILHIRDERFLLLNGWFWSGVVVGGALVVSPAIAAYRILIVLPAALVFVALGVVKIIDLAERAARLKPIYAHALIGVFLASAALLNLKAYWVDWVPKCKYEDVATRFASQMGTFLSTQPRNSQVFLAGEPIIHYGIHRSVDFLDGGIPIVDFIKPLTAPPQIATDPNRALVFIFTAERQNELAYVQQVYPNGVRSEIKDCGRTVMITYKVVEP